MELKVRAWDDVAKKMTLGAVEKFDDMLGFRFHHFETEKPVFMLCTGIKDINSKDIYAGDIVKGVGRHQGQSEVFFDAGVWQPFSFLSDYSGQEFEIVGNIFENPEMKCVACKEPCECQHPETPCKE